MRPVDQGAWKASSCQGNFAVCVKGMTPPCWIGIWRDPGDYCHSMASSWANMWPHRLDKGGEFGIYCQTHYQLRPGAPHAHGIENNLHPRPFFQPPLELLHKCPPLHNLEFGANANLPQLRHDTFPP